jgi:hypothetical protein
MAGITDMLARFRGLFPPVVETVPGELYFSAEGFNSMFLELPSVLSVTRYPHTVSLVRWKMKIDRYLKRFVQDRIFGFRLVVSARHLMNKALYSCSKITVHCATYKVTVLPCIQQGSPLAIYKYS